MIFLNDRLNYLDYLLGVSVPVTYPSWKCDSGIQKHPLFFLNTKITLLEIHIGYVGVFSHTTVYELGNNLLAKKNTSWLLVCLIHILLWAGRFSYGVRTYKSNAKETGNVHE